MLALRTVQERASWILRWLPLEGWWVMADYINRDSVIELSREYYSQGLKEKAVPVTAIRNIPSADVVEVRHGEWINKTMSVPSSHGQTYGRYGCSVCKNKVRYKSNFCPNCGADMRKDGGT